MPADFAASAHDETSPAHPEFAADTSDPSADEISASVCPDAPFCSIASASASEAGDVDTFSSDAGSCCSRRAVKSCSAAASATPPRHRRT